VFVHGCFWHGHDCAFFRWPKSRQEFWREKIGKNVTRDAKVAADLRAAGWRVLTIWECGMRGKSAEDIEAALDAAAAWLRSVTIKGEIRG
jgi:DNA mismatch endonuclease (patch repair protein)